MKNNIAIIIVIWACSWHSTTAQNAKFPVADTESIPQLTDFRILIEVGGEVWEATLHDLELLKKVGIKYSLQKKSLKKKKLWRNMKKALLAGSLDTGLRYFQRKVLDMENPSGLFFVRMTFGL